MIVIWRNRKNGKGSRRMEEKIYKTMGGAGVLNIVLGVVAVITGVVTGVLLLIAGAKLVTGRTKLMF